MTFIKFVLHLVKQTRQIMKSHLLFPHHFRSIGFVLAVTGLILSYLFLFQLPWILSLVPKLTPSIVAIGIYENIIYKFNVALLLIGLLFIAFSKVKNEDELTAHIRLNSLYWAILINYLCWFVLIGIVIVLKDGDYYLVATFYPFNIAHVNLFMPLIIFMLRFFYLLNKNKDEYYTPPLYFLPHRPYNKIAKVLLIISLLVFVALLFNFSNTPRGLYIEQYDFWYYLRKVFKLTPFIFLLWLYTSEPKEDEYINAIRLHAMQTAIYVNYGLLLLTNTFLSEINFMMDEFDLSIIPLIFIIVFQYRLHQLPKDSEERSGSKITLNTL